MHSIVPSPDQTEPRQKADFTRVQFAAVLVFHDSREWGRDIQLMIDVLRSQDGVFGTEEKQAPPPGTQIPLYFSHGDLCRYSADGTLLLPFWIKLVVLTVSACSVGKRPLGRAVRTGCVPARARECMAPHDGAGAALDRVWQATPPHVRVCTRAAR